MCLETERAPWQFPFFSFFFFSSARTGGDFSVIPGGFNLLRNSIGSRNRTGGREGRVSGRLVSGNLTGVKRGEEKREKTRQFTDDERRRRPRSAGIVSVSLARSLRTICPPPPPLSLPPPPSFWESHGRAFRALVSCQSYQGCRENESSPVDGCGKKCVVSSHRRERLGNRFSESILLSTRVPLCSFRVIRNCPGFG